MPRLTHVTNEMKKQSLLSAFDALLGPRIEPVPIGFQTVEQIASERGESAVTISHKLHRLANAQKVERIKGRNSSGRVCWFYRVKSKSPSQSKAL